MQFGGLFYAIMTLFKHIKLLLDAFISSNTFLCTWTIKIINYSVIKCQKNGAKMNKIVQKWQFQKTFYTTMETVLGFSQNRLAELFQNYVFSTNQYLYFDLYVAECQIQFSWPASRFGVYVRKIHFSEDYSRCVKSFFIPRNLLGKWTKNTLQLLYHEEWERKKR